MRREEVPVMVRRADPCLCVHRGVRYNKLAGEIKSLVAKLAEMEAHDEVRKEVSEGLTRKCFHLGLITSDSSLAACAKVSASAFCRYCRASPSALSDRGRTPSHLTRLTLVPNVVWGVQPTTAGRHGSA